MTLSPSQRDSTCAGADELRDRLPVYDALSVSEIGAQWVNAEGGKACERERADGLVAVFDRLKSEWEAWANERQR